MGKRIVLCLDGTSDFAESNPSHVFRLYQLLARNDEQSIYYDGGVGTLQNQSLLFKFAILVNQGLDLVAGFSIRDNFIKAFEFLCDEYEEGDEIILFGFSRGAYAARAIVAGLHYFGVPEQSNKNLIPYLWQSFSSMKSEDFRSLNRLKSAVNEKESPRRNPKVSFVGLWDTVSSFGLIGLRTLPGTRKLEQAEMIRHAVSIDEKRSLFPANLVDSSHPNLKEVWFAGVHRDVGGGGKTGKLELSMCTFEWMLGEALTVGLGINEDKLRKKKFIPANPQGPMNDDIKARIAFIMIGSIPMRMWTQSKNAPPGFKWRIPGWTNHRRIAPDSLVHRSVETRLKKGNYRPINLKSVTIKIQDSKPLSSIFKPKSDDDFGKASLK